MRHRAIRCSVFVFISACFILTGCRSMWPFKKKPRITPTYQSALLPPGGTDMGIDIPLGRDEFGTTDWEPIGTGSAMSRRPGSIVPISDRRWAGVVVYFAYDRSTLGTAERPKIEALAQYLLEHPTYSVAIEGHCDERGSEEYNRGLGERRALAIRDYLVSLGIDGSRSETVSYGEERPAVPNATVESQHQKNRRAEFVVGIRS